jgi:hypothetical protein
MSAIADPFAAAHVHSWVADPFVYWRKAERNYYKLERCECGAERWGEAVPRLRDEAPDGRA